MFLSKNVQRLLKSLNISSSRSFVGSRSLSTVDNEKFKGNYDVIIAGGGMVGCALACAMTKNSILSNLKVLLLEGGSENKFDLKPEYSNRVVALNPATKDLMTSLSVWQHVEMMRLQPVKYMHVWDACSNANISFNNADIIDEDIAYIVENDVLLHAIYKEILDTNNKNLNIHYGAKIADYQLPRMGDAVPRSTVKMANGDTYTCELLIGADGANSSVRKTMGAQYVTWSYEQMGVVATLQLAEECVNTTAWQRFLPTGPIALLPLDSQRSSLVWSTWKDQAKELLNMTEEKFVDAVNNALWKQYPLSPAVETATSWMTSALKFTGLPDGTARLLPPSVSGACSRAAFPLAFGHSAQYIAPGVALIGDAAHRVHPLAGQGVNLGFGDVKELSELLSENLYSGLDLRHPSWLQKYQTSRQRHVVPTQLAIEALHRLYTVDIPPVVVARSVGLQLTNALEPLKKLIMSHAAA